MCVCILLLLSNGQCSAVFEACVSDEAFSGDFSFYICTKKTLILVMLLLCSFEKKSY